VCIESHKVPCVTYSPAGNAFRQPVLKATLLDFVGHMIVYGTVRSSCLASSAKVTFIGQMRA
jgi:hypothetical protein